MRQVFWRKPTERQVLNELLSVADHFHPGILNDHIIQFYDGPNAWHYAEKKILAYPSIEYTEAVSGQPYDWKNYWATVFHELAHAISHEWFGENNPGGSHGWTFYAILMALSMYVDLPFRSYESFEESYHPLRWKQGKNLAADLIMDRIRSTAYSEFGCEKRPIYSTEYCDSIDSCTVHPKKGSSKQSKRKPTA